MSFDTPHAARPWPPRASVVYLVRVGTKCIVSFLPDKEGIWLEAGGVIRPKASCDSKHDEPLAGVGLDTRQARIYFRCNGQEQIPECRVLLPDDFHFRSSRQGMVKSRTKSFDEDGNPVQAVRLLYALKTGSHDDRLRAVEAFPTELWGAGTFGQMFSAMDDAARTDHNFRIFAGEQLARAATQESGLANWLLWEKVADAAAAFKREKLARAELEHDPHNHSVFLQAVKENAIKFRGLPAQLHVKKRWEDLGGEGDWIEIRNMLGFAWLPGERDWKKSWAQQGQKAGGG